MSAKARACASVAATLFLGAATAIAGPSRVPHPDLVRVEERLGETLPLETVFTASDGRPVRLGDLFKDEKPVILVLAYERCPMLCGLVHSSAVQAVKGLDWAIGQQFRARHGELRSGRVSGRGGAETGDAPRGPGTPGPARSLALPDRYGSRRSRRSPNASDSLRIGIR